MNVDHRNLDINNFPRRDDLVNPTTNEITIMFISPLRLDISDGPVSHHTTHFRTFFDCKKIDIY